MFRDRSDAGQRLAEKLKVYAKEKPIILALPRGGVPIGYEVAKKLNAPLDIFVVRKIGTPWNPEYGIGAVASGIQVLDENALHMLRLKPSDLQLIIKREQE